MARYEDPIALLRRRYGDKFSSAGLDSRFIPFFNNGMRIRVSEAGQEKTGTVGMSAGLQPTFILMLRSSSIASSVLLGPQTAIMGVKRNGRYVRYIG